MYECGDHRLPTVVGWLVVVLYAVVLYRLQGSGLFVVAAVGAVLYLAVFGIQFRFGSRRPPERWLRDDRPKIVQNVLTMTGLLSAIAGAIAGVVLLGVSFVR